MNSIAPLARPAQTPSQTPAWARPRRALRVLAQPQLEAVPLADAPARGTASGTVNATATEAAQTALPPAPVPFPEGAAAHSPEAARRVARLVTQALAEALRGERTITQLGHHLDLECYRKVERRVRWEREARELARAPRDPGPLRPVSCHVQDTMPGACECTATLAGADRVRVIAFRLEVARGRWRCVEVEIG